MYYFNLTANKRSAPYVWETCLTGSAVPIDLETGAIMGLARSPITPTTSLGLSQDGA